MKVLFISPNREKEPYVAAPLGIAYLSAVLLKEGYNVKVLDLCFEDEPVSATKKTLNDFQPDIIGISIRNLESSTTFLIPTIKDVVDCCKDYGRGKIILGGTAFSITPEDMLRYFDVDLGIIGEGEESLPELLRRLSDKKPFDDIAGAAYIDNKSDFRMNMPWRLQDINRLPMPARHLLPNHLYDMGNIQTKRGCEYSCIYCTYPFLEGKNVRLRSPENIANEMEEMINKYNITNFYFVDNVFNSPESHAKEICAEIIKRRLDIQWSALISPRNFSKELLNLMIDAGCKSVEIGSDAASSVMLKRLGKNFSVDDIRHAAKMCDEAGLMHMHFLLLGGPGETEETLKETLKNMEEINPPKVFAVASIRLYPNTPIQRLAEKEGKIKKGESLFYPKFYISDDISSRLFEIMDEFIPRHPNWMYFPANAVKMPNEVAEVKVDKKEIIWKKETKERFDEIIKSVPMLLQPIARRMVNKKAMENALVRGSSFVEDKDMINAFVSETPRPFQSKMREKVAELGLSGWL